MFVGHDVLEFINKIINESNTLDKETVKENIGKFSEYLRLTKMCDEETLKSIELITSCVDELMLLKEKIGRVDVNSILQTENNTDRPMSLRKTKASTYDDKHYGHYSTSSYSSNCGSGSSYSSGCGGGSSYRGGC